MPAAQGVILISANIDNNVVLRLDDETTHSLTQVADAVMSLGRRFTHSVLSQIRYLARMKERVSGQSGDGGILALRPVAVRCH